MTDNTQNKSEIFESAVTESQAIKNKKEFLESLVTQSDISEEQLDFLRLHSDLHDSILGNENISIDAKEKLINTMFERGIINDNQREHLYDHSGVSDSISAKEELAENVSQVSENVVAVAKSGVELMKEKKVLLLISIASLFCMVCYRLYAKREIQDQRQRIEEFEFKESKQEIVASLDKVMETLDKDGDFQEEAVDLKEEVNKLEFNNDPRALTPKLEYLQEKLSKIKDANGDIPDKTVIKNMIKTQEEKQSKNESIPTKLKNCLLSKFVSPDEGKKM